MQIGDWVTLAALVGVVVAVVMGRRRGKQRFQAAMSAARATGAAEAKAELAAQLTNMTIVNAGNSGHDPRQSDTSDDVLLAALRRIAVGGDYPSEQLHPGVDHDHFSAALDRARMVDSVGAEHVHVEQSPDWPRGADDWNAHPDILGDGEEMK